MKRSKVPNPTGKLLKKRFIRTILTTILLSFLPLIIIWFIDSMVPDTLEDAPSAAERLCEDPRDIYIQDYLDHDGSAAVIDKDMNIIELGGSPIFEGKDSITMDELAEFLTPSASDTGYMYQIAYHEGEDPYWLILRIPVYFSFVLNLDIGLSNPNTYPTAIVLLASLVLYFVLLFVFAVLYSSGTAKAIRAIEEEEEKKRMLLVSEISHDLKTPLASVQGYSELLLKKDISEETRQDYLKIIHDDSVRTNEILQSLFVYSKLESAGYKIDPERTDICEFIRQIIARYITVFDDAGFTYEFSVPEEEIFADIDTGLMSRVFDNLIENALKYNEPGTKIKIGVRADKNIEMIVEDNGCGISKEHRAKIWEPFYRADQSSKGSGLGLAIVRQIVELHGGNVRLDEGNGCRWVISIPVSKKI